MRHRTAPFTLVLAFSTAVGFAQAPLGSEFRVNTFTTNNQIDAAVAPLAGGNFVVVWSGNGPGDYSGVFGQRFSSAGAKIGSEFRVNTNVAFKQGAPEVASDPTGAFVVVWESLGGQDGDATGVFARRFDASGAAIGLDFQVNTYTTNDQYRPAVSADAAGNFVVAWASYDQTGDEGYGIFAQRFNASGGRLGGEVHVNTVTAYWQGNTAVSMGPAGDFVVVWDSQTGAEGYQVFMQRYDETGYPLSGEQQVTFPIVMDGSGYASVAKDKTGAFVVVWTEFYYGAGVQGVFGRRFDPDGFPRGDEFTVNSYTTGTQRDPKVALDAGGNFVVTWWSNQQDGSGNGIFAQVYDAAGERSGGEFRANTTTAGDQQYPAAAMYDSGRFVVAWESYASQDGSGGGIFAQRFLADPIFRNGFEEEASP